MRNAEFEEKDFENPLYVQLLSGNICLATPGQVFEGRFGVDAALQAGHPFFWDLFGYRTIPGGINLNDYNWGWVWRDLGRRRPLPSFAINLLIQAKRPQYLSGVNATLSRLGIKHDYWRFEISQHQHDLLAAIQRTLANRALLIYASTAFDTYQELYEYTANNQLVENCAYVSVPRMTEHHSWNYDHPGTSGVASSDPKPIDDPPLPAQIDNLIQQASYSDDVFAQLDGLYHSVLSVSEEHASQNPIASVYMRRNENLQARIRDARIERHEVLPFLGVIMFFQQLSTNWFLVGGKDSVLKQERRS